MKKHLIYILLLSLTMTSCNKWIDVHPTDRISENELFTKKEGFLKALNGIYIAISDPELYGRFLTAGELDVMGQYYMKASTYHNYSMFMAYQHSDAVSKAAFDATWKKAYSSIMNINILLEKCGDEPSSNLPEPYFSLVKGEALALRAFLHFDMLRVFGPIYASDSQKEAIPYYTLPNFEIEPLYSSQVICEKVLADFQLAKQLLKNVDPIQTDGVRIPTAETLDNSLNYRQYRLNYFAIDALQARVHLWMGNLEQAGSIAKATIAAVQQEAKPIFPFVKAADATNNLLPDRLFSSEVMFAVYTVNRAHLYNTLFSANLDLVTRLYANTGNAVMTRVDAMYSDKNDYRYKIWEVVNNNGNLVLVNQKFQDAVDLPARYMLPLVRISELYLIAAECESDLATATNFVNKLRLNRNAISLQPATAAALQQLIYEEYRREFIGEGQQFYYYKRHAFTTRPSETHLTSNTTMDVTNYQVPLPDSETSMRSPKNN